LDAPEAFHLFRCGPAELTEVRKLGTGEFSSYKEAVDHLREFDKSPDYLHMVERNHAEFHQTATAWSTQAEHICKDSAYRNNLALEFNRRFVNYLSSARLLLDHYETRLKRRYGKESKEVSGFKTECSASYDGHFAYRFLYRTRNYAQHFGMPATHPHARSHMDSPSSPVAYEAWIRLDAQDLLRRGGDLWGKVAPEIEKQGSLIDVVPHVSTMTNELKRIVSAAQTLERPRLLESGVTIASIVKDAIADGKTPAVGLTRYDPPHTNIEFTQPPFQVLQWLGLKGFETPL